MTNFDSVSPPSSASRGMELFTQPIEIFLWLNAGVINVFQSATVSWMQRRQEAARDAIASFEKLVHSRDFGEANDDPARVDQTEHAPPRRRVQLIDEQNTRYSSRGRNGWSERHRE